jgi:hypothetical protein
MPDIPEEFEVVDRQGTTEQFNGTVDTLGAQVPGVAGNVIAEVLVRNKLSNPSSVKLLVSLDGGVTFFTLNRSEHMIWGLKGAVTQIEVKASSSTVDYEIIMNREIV